MMMMILILKILIIDIAFPEDTRVRIMRFKKKSCSKGKFSISKVVSKYECQKTVLEARDQRC